MNKLDKRSGPRAFLQVEATKGDFPHVRGRSVKLACGCTTCCFVFLGGAVGVVAGLITGIVRGVRINLLDREHYSKEDLAATFWGRLFRATFRLLVFGLLYATMGLFIGAAIGLGIDMLGDAF